MRHERTDYPFDSNRYFTLLTALRLQLERTGLARDVIRVHPMLTALSVSKLETLIEWLNQQPDRGQIV